MNFCPKWVFETACAHSASQFLSSALDVQTVSRGTEQTLSKFYQGVSHIEIASFIDSVVRFLDEVKAGDSAVDLLVGFCFSRVNFEGPRKPRKMKSLLASADDPVKTKDYSAQEASTSFRAYVFALRNDVAELPPSGWRLTDVNDSQVIHEIAKQVINPLDFL